MDDIRLHTVRLTGHCGSRRRAFRLPVVLCTALAVLAVSVQAGEPKEVKTQAKPKIIERVVAYDSGQLTVFHLRIGDAVVAGQIVASLDDDDQQHRLDVARIRAADTSAVRRAQARLDLQQARYEDAADRRRRHLINDNVLSQYAAEVAAAQAELDQARVNADLAKLEEDRAERALEKRRMRAPIAGIVLEVLKIQGDMIGKGTVVARIGDPQSVTLAVELPDAVLDALEEGGTVPLRMADGRIVHTTVESIGAPVKGKKGFRQVELSPVGNLPHNLSLTELSIFTLPATAEDLITKVPVINSIISNGAANSR